MAPSTSTSRGGGSGVRLTGTPPVTQPASAQPNVLIFWAEQRTGAENGKACGSLRAMECWEERSDGAERLGPGAQRSGL